MSQLKIKKITIEFEGKPTFEIPEPDDTAALFFTESMTKNLLVSHYYARGENTKASQLLAELDSSIDGKVIRKRPNCTYDIIP